MELRLLSSPDMKALKNVAMLPLLTSLALHLPSGTAAAGQLCSLGSQVSVVLKIPCLGKALKAVKMASRAF